MAWWHNRPLLADFVIDLIHAELSKARPGQPLPARPWPDSMALGEEGLGLDSMEKLTLAAALAEALRLDRSGLEDHLLARSSIGSWIELSEMCLDRFDRSMVFLTSGSTGLPKRCEHPIETLEQEAAFLAELFKDRKRIVSMVSCRHIYGFLFSVLLPERLGIPRLRWVDKSTVALGAELLPGDLVIGFPDIWRLAARTVERFPPDLAAVSSTAPLPHETDAELAERGVARLVEIYGSSETAGIGWREAPSAEFELFPFWSRSSGGQALRRPFPNGTSPEVRPQDHLRWISDRRFVPAGRLDRAFQVGGVNVHPERVEAVLLLHPAVAAASVRRMRPEEGGRAKAFIVPKAGSQDIALLSAELEAWCADHLLAAERPKAYSFGAALPHDALGKPIDWS